MDCFSDCSVVDSDEEVIGNYYQNYFNNRRASMENESNTESDNESDNLCDTNNNVTTITFPPPSPTNPYRINFPLNWVHDNNNDANDVDDANNANNANNDNNDNNFPSPVDKRKKQELQREFDLIQASYRKWQSIMYKYGIKSFGMMRKAIEAMKARQPCRSKFGIGIFAHERPKKTVQN
jgi:hypothetical protein